MQAKYIALPASLPRGLNDAVCWLISVRSYVGRISSLNEAVGRHVSDANC